MLRHNAFVSSTLLSLAIFASSAHAGDQGRAKELFQEGLTLFRQGNYEESLAKLQESLKEEPDAATAQDLFQTTENALWLEMLTKEGEFEKIARRYMSLASSARRANRDDAAAIEALIEKVKSEDFTTRRKASYQLSANHGEFAVPYLVKLLGNNAPAEFRLNAMSALTDLRGDAVMPLAMTLGTSDLQLKRAALMVLGRIADARAIPFVKRIAESDADAPTREIAQSALKDITRQRAQRGDSSGATTGATAHDLFCEMGEACLRGDARLVRGIDTGEVVWSFTDETGLTKTAIPASLYATEIARVAFAQALAIDPNSKKAASGLVMAYGATMAAADTIRAQADEDAKKNAEPFALRAELGLAACGKSNLNTGLAAAVAMGESPIAKSVAEALGRLGTPGTPEYPTALTEALRSSDKRVRYAAAISLARLAPAQSNPNAAGLVATLASAVAEETVRVVSVIDENAERRSRIVGQMKDAGYHAVVAESGAIGLGQIRRYGAADLIVISSTLPDLSTEQMLTEFKDDARTAGIPVFVVSDKRGLEKAKEAFADRAKQIVDGAMALDLTTVAEAVATRENPDRTMAEEMAQEAAISLASLDATIFDLKPAASGLLTAIQTKQDATAIPAAQAMGNAGTIEQTQALIAVLGDAKRSTELRTAVGVAIARIFSRAQSVPSTQIEALAKIVREETSAEIRKAAATAIGGAANLTPADRVKVFVQTL